MLGLALILALTSCGGMVGTPTPTPATAQTGSWVLEVESPGPHWLGPEWFQTRGIEPDLAPGDLQLRLGQEAIPYLLLQTAEGPGLFFYANHTPSRYASWTAYRLDARQGAGQVMRTAPGAGQVTAGGQTVGWARLWQEEDVQYRPQIRAPEPWFWEPLHSGGRLTHTVEISQAVAGPITVTIRFWGREALASPAPAPRIWWNGEQVGTWQWQGPEEQSWPATLTAPGQTGEHVLAVDLPEQADGSISQLWLDGWGVTYRRPLRWGPPGIAWTAEQETATITGADGARLLDVTDPGAPVDLGVVSGEMVATQPGHRYWAGFPPLAPEPARSRPLSTIDGAMLEEVDYLIIAAEPFWDALQPLVEHRQGQGLSVVRLSPTQVYDATGDGRPDPAAIRSLVQQLHGQGKLRYLLLVGDASTQADGYAAEDGALLVVTDLIPTANLHETPSDQTMITDIEGRPLVAVGRFPAETPAQVETMVRKTLGWEEGGLAQALVVSDDQADFGRFADGITPWLPEPLQRLDAAEETSRSQLLEQLHQAGTWLNYVGHGSLALWGDERLLQRDDEWSEPAAVTVWACLSGYFVHPREDSMAEVWLRSAQGGAAAFVGPTGETYLYQQLPLAETFYQEIQSGQPVGDALLAAWQNASDAEQDAVRSYLLLGDPALQLRAP